MIQYLKDAEDEVVVKPAWFYIAADDIDSNLFSWFVEGLTDLVVDIDSTPVKTQSESRKTVEGSPVRAKHDIMVDVNSVWPQWQPGALRKRCVLYAHSLPSQRRADTPVHRTRHGIRRPTLASGDHYAPQDDTTVSSRMKELARKIRSRFENTRDAQRDDLDFRAQCQSPQIDITRQHKQLTGSNVMYLHPGCCVLFMIPARALGVPVYLGYVVYLDDCAPTEHEKWNIPAQVRERTEGKKRPASWSQETILAIGMSLAAKKGTPSLLLEQTVHSEALSGREQRVKVAVDYAESRIQDCIDKSLIGKGVMETTAIFVAARWVALASQPLHFVELFDATVHDPVLRCLPEEATSGQCAIKDFKHLAELTSNLLIISGDGTVKFRLNKMKERIMRKIEIGANAPQELKYGHKEIATSCLEYLWNQGKDIFVPLLFSQDLTPYEYGSQQTDNLVGPANRYRATCWQSHYRAAESTDNDLPALLHRLIVSAASTGASRHTSSFELSSRCLNLGLETCTTHHFKVLGGTYLEMGAAAKSDDQVAPQPILQLDRHQSPEFPDVLGLTARRRKIRTSRSTTSLRSSRAKTAPVAKQAFTGNKLQTYSVSTERQAPLVEDIPNTDRNPT